MEHQHYIPRSYLRNFASNNGKKYFVDVFDVVRNVLRQSISTDDICVKRNLYTLPFDKDDKFKIGKYYAQNIDSTFPQIYNLLLNNRIRTITEEQRIKIMLAVISLYLRTPKHLSKFNHIDDQFVEFAVMSSTNKSKIIIDHKGSKITFAEEDKEKIKSILSERNRIEFVLTHLEILHNFVFNKYKGVFNVYRTNGSLPFITSDNPVTISSSYPGVKTTFHLFNPANYIELPLDQNHVLAIIPESSTSNIHRIHRENRDDAQVIFTNHGTAKSADLHIIGYPGTIDTFQQAQTEAEKDGTYYNELIKNAPIKAQLGSELLALMQKHRPINQTVADKVRKMRKSTAFKNNNELENIILALAKKGFLTV